MLFKAPSNDWSEQFEHYVIEEDNESLSEFEDEPTDFSEYLWMENEEEFDKLEMQRLEDEHVMNECLEAMLEDELEAELAEMSRNEEMNAALSSLVVNKSLVEKSLLNPLAAEFIPRGPILDLGTS